MREVTARLGCVIVCAAAAAGAPEGAVTGAPMTTRGLTAIDGLAVGHDTLDARPTGCTVVLTEAGATATVDVRGASPGTRETALLHPTNRVQQVHAVVLSGGSAFGLAAADGVMRYLDERGIGFPTGGGPVPIVPAAILYDLTIGDGSIRPDAECGYRAAQAATTAGIEEGSVGAGAGATVGKLGGPGRAMKGGIGTALVELPDGMQVAALIAVNAVGDVHDPETGALVAGVRTADGRALEGAGGLFRQPPDVPGGQNTTIGVVATNVPLTKAQLGIVARMAHDGLALAIRPAHTPMDGDTIFALSTGTADDVTPDTALLRVGAIAANVTAEAIVRAVREATGIPGYPAVGELSNDAQENRQ